MNIKWQGYIEERRIELLKKYTIQKTAEILSKEFNTYVSFDMVNNRCRRVRNQNILNNEIENNYNIKNENIIKQDEIKLFDEEFYNENKFISSPEIKKEMTKIWDKFNDNKSHKILSLSDLHAPFIDFERVEQAIKDNLDCDIVILNGDTLDSSCASSFDKKQEINFEEEFKQIFAVLDVLTEKFKHIIIINGNHDGSRISRYIMKNIVPGMRNYAFEKLNPLNHIASKYNNVIYLNHNVLELYDVIFTHPNFFNSPELRTVVNEYEILTANKNDLPNPDFKMVVIGHSHQGGEIYFKSAKLIEQGCLTLRQDYNFMNPVKKPWSSGYARIEINNSKVDLNKSKFIYLGNV